MQRDCPNCGHRIKLGAFLLAALRGKRLAEAPGVLSCPHCGHIIATAILNQSWVVHLWVLAGAIFFALIAAPFTSKLTLLLWAILLLVTLGIFFIGVYRKTVLSQTPSIFLSFEDNALCIQPQGYPITSPHASIRRIRVEDIDSVRITDEYFALYLKPAKAAIDVWFQPELQQQILGFLANNLPEVRVEIVAAP